MPELVSIRINRQKIQAQLGTNLLEVLKENKIDIPDFLFESAGKKIRTCLVEIGRGEIKPAHEVQVVDRLKVQTNSGLARQYRHELLVQAYDYHLAHCDQFQTNGDCQMAQQILACIKTGGVDSQLPNSAPYHLMSNSVEIDPTVCIGCGACVKTCLQKQVGYLTLKGEGKNKKAVANSNPKIGCIYCGQCTLVCPTNAIREQVQVSQVEAAIADPDKTVIVQMAPSIRTSIGEEFGAEAGNNLTNQMYTALRKLGFDKIFDVNWGADITTLVEAEELVESIKHNNRPLPMFTSCCPSWVQFIRFYYPDMVENFSSARSPQIHAGGAYKTWWAKQAGVNPKQIVVVSIMPCTSKKHEARLEQLKIDGMYPVDYVLTTRETAYLLKKNKIDPTQLPESEPDQLGGYSGAAAIYGASGGVAESALRTAAWLLEGKDLPKLEFEQVRGIAGMKKAEVSLAGQTIKIAVVSTMRNARKVVEEIRSNSEAYHCVEVMACPGGCIGGGGQPKPTNQDKIEKRMAGLYDIDQKSKMRKAHENQLAQEFIEYAHSLETDDAHQLLHTHYAAFKAEEK